MQNSSTTVASGTQPAASPTPRAADYTIKGFLYQFHKTIIEILRASADAEITVEGVVEDIDIISPGHQEAIQCKYHEAQEHFIPSAVYKPLLQMMTSFHKNQTAGIKYKIYAYFQDKKEGESWKPSKAELTEVLDTKNEKFIKLANPLRNAIDLDAFASVFSCNFGHKYEALVGVAHQALKENGIANDDIEILAYPHAITEIASLSIRHDPKARRTTRAEFVSRIKSVKKIALTRWTRELRGRDAILRALRQQIKEHLNHNARSRLFLISESIDQFDDGIVMFISDYIAKYHSKIAHTEIPCIVLDCNEAKFNSLLIRMNEKKLPVWNGYVGPTFTKSNLFSEHISRKHVRVARYQADTSIVHEPRCEDLFIVSDDFKGALPKDVNCEILSVSTLDQLKQLLGI